MATGAAGFWRGVPGGGAGGRGGHHLGILLGGGRVVGFVQGAGPQAGPGGVWVHRQGLVGGPLGDHLQNGRNQVGVGMALSGGKVLPEQVLQLLGSQLFQPGVVSQ